MQCLNINQLFLLTTVFSQTFLMPRYAIFMTEKKERQTETERLKRMREIADSKEARERKSKFISK